ncbi:hypothetical protein PROFUN_09586 [Planoprotostelium fungivorum]|uniref:Uncharacterized protein n=1 Tax=Planoprotostelium fungivorum TaxID=1890364 RepID=A0A2P6NGS5_9EUKA|nr:hypothetical protein PROFUN_09586 [Planoprotostelium fungivorum]
MEVCRDLEEKIQSLQTTFIKILEAKKNGASTKELEQQAQAIVLLLRGENRSLYQRIDKHKEKLSQIKTESDEGISLKSLLEKEKSLRYEEARLREEINSCQNFSTPAIDRVQLISEEEFDRVASTELKSKSTDPHQKRIQQYHHEMQERKRDTRLCIESERLTSKKKELTEKTMNQRKMLLGLQSKIDTIYKLSGTIQEAVYGSSGVPQLKQIALAKDLPTPLYILYHSTLVAMESHPEKTYAVDFFYDTQRNYVTVRSNTVGLLTSLFPFDEGSHSPNPLDSSKEDYEIKNVKYGRPYKWVQGLCKLYFLPSDTGNREEMDSHLINIPVLTAIHALRNRYNDRVSLQHELSSLQEKTKVMDAAQNEYRESHPSTPGSVSVQLMSWKEVPSPKEGYVRCKGILKRDKEEIECSVDIAPTYPSPSSVAIQFSSRQTEVVSLLQSQLDLLQLKTHYPLSEKVLSSIASLSS